MLGRKAPFGGPSQPWGQAHSAHIGGALAFALGSAEMPLSCHVQDSPRRHGTFEWHFYLDEALVTRVHRAIYFGDEFHETGPDIDPLQRVHLVSI